MFFSKFFFCTNWWMKHATLRSSGWEEIDSRRQRERQQKLVTQTSHRLSKLLWKKRATHTRAHQCSDKQTLQCLCLFFEIVPQFNDVCFRLFCCSCGWSCELSRSPNSLERDVWNWTANREHFLCVFVGEHREDLQATHGRYKTSVLSVFKMIDEILLTPWQPRN